MSFSFEILSTGALVQSYFEANGISVENLVKESGISVATIYRFLKGEAKISVRIADALESLGIGLVADDLIAYDARYWAQEKRKENELGLSQKDIRNIVTKYKLGKFFPDIKGPVALFERAAELVGKQNFLSCDISQICPVDVRFSKANGSDDELANFWISIAYNEAKEIAEKKGEKLVLFNGDLLSRMMAVDMKKLSRAYTLEQTAFNLQYFFSKSGVNFHFRNSVPGCRIKGAVVRDKDGYVFVFASNLFKCIERLWLAMIHECLHLLHGDFDVVDLDTDENENLIDETVIKFLVCDDMTENRDYSVSEIFDIARRNNVAPGLVAEIARFRSGNYKNYQINKLIHYYKDKL